MGLLELEHITKRYRHGARQIDVLLDVSLELHERELLAVWGPRGSGRSTLLRIAAGIEAPDRGEVRFHGRHLLAGATVIGSGVAYCQPTLRSPEAQVVIEEMVASQLALGVRPAGARARAWAALERVGAGRCGERRPTELDRAETVRVGIARGLLQEPSLLLIDEPTTSVAPLERDSVLELLHSLSREGVAVLMTLDSGVGLFAADRALSLADGILRGHAAPELAPVVELPLRLSG
jgi:ABC-type lipoprotein export system ATPase subunit